MTDEEFVREVYSGCYRRLVGQLFAVCGDLPTAEDTVQEAFARAVAQARTFRRTDKPEAWLYRVAVHIHHSRWRRMKRQVGLQHAVPRPDVGAELSPDHVALMTALKTLPSVQREAIVLHHLVDLSVHEVATVLGVPEGTVKARLSRGRAALSLVLSERDGGDMWTNVHLGRDSQPGIPLTAVVLGSGASFHAVVLPDDSLLISISAWSDRAVAGLYRSNGADWEHLTRVDAGLASSADVEGDGVDWLFQLLDPAIDPSTSAITLYALDASDQLFTSTDEGATWTQHPTR